MTVNEEEMMQPGQTLAMYTQLMAINALAFAEGQYEVAYHALAAALHCAHDLRDSDRVVAVQQRTDSVEAIAFGPAEQAPQDRP